MGFVVGHIAYNDNLQIVHSFTGVGEQNFRQIVTALTEASSYAKRAEGHLLVYLILHDRADKDKFPLRCASLQQQLAIVSAKMYNPAARIKLEEIKQLADRILPLGKSLIDIHDHEIAVSGECEIKKHAEALRELFNITSSVRQKTVELAKYEIELEDNGKIYAINQAKFMQEKLILLGWISLIAALFFSYYIARYIARPLAELKKMAGMIGSGNLEVRMPAGAGDEIGAMAEAFNYMAENLQASNRQLKQSEAKYSSYVENAPDGIFVIGENGRFIEVNRAACLLSGYSKEELLNMSCLNMSSEEALKAADNYFKLLMEKGSVSVEAQFKRKDALVRWASAEVVKLTDTRFLGFVKDITPRKETEDKIKSLLAEKEIILKEVHHRIKNNMNNVIGIMTLQSSTLTDSSAIAALKNARGRVKSMMVLYDKLYRSKDFKKISFKEYISSLVDEIICNFPNSEIVKVEKNIDDFISDVNTLSTCGIIINELLTNIMKYAFDGRDSGLITISSVMASDGRVKITIADDGIGIPEFIDIANSKGFGLKLVDMLTSALHGTIKIERDNGSKFILEFEL